MRIAIKKPIQNGDVIVRDFVSEDFRDLAEIARSNAASDFAWCDEQWPTDDDSARGMAEYMATDSAMTAIYSKKEGKVVCFVNFNGVGEDNYLDIGHVMNLAYAGRDYEYQGLKLIFNAAFNELDIAGIQAYWAFDDKVKLEPLLKLGMKVVNKHQSNYFGGKEGTFTGCELKVSRAEYTDL